MTKDYDDFLKEFNLNDEDLLRISRDRSDHFELNRKYPLFIDLSPIHGSGVYSRKSFKKWEIICPVRVVNKRTIYGRKMNHSDKPNAVFVYDQNNTIAVAFRSVVAGEELLVNYRQSRLISTRDDSEG